MEYIKKDNKLNILYEKIQYYYEHLDDAIKNLLYDIIAGTNKISISFIEWYVRSYLYDNDTIVHKSFILYSRTYRKKNFDFYRRGPTFIFTLNEDINMLTTLGQLNAFKWLTENNILTTIEDNYDNLISEYQFRKKYIKKNT
jgi:hypothetical protein